MNFSIFRRPAATTTSCSSGTWATVVRLTRQRQYLISRTETRWKFSRK